MQRDKVFTTQNPSSNPNDYWIWFKYKKVFYTEIPVMLLLTDAQLDSYYMNEIPFITMTLFPKRPLNTRVFSKIKELRTLSAFEDEEYYYYGIKQNIKDSTYNFIGFITGGIFILNDGINLLNWQGTKEKLKTNYGISYVGDITVIK